MEILSRFLNQRLKFVIIFSIMLLILSSFYLFHLQVNLKSSFTRLGEQNFLRYEKIVSARGNIVDKHGRLLATSRPFDSIYWKGTGNKNLTTEQEEILDAIISLCGLKSETKSDVIQAERKCNKICLVEGTSFAIISYLKEKFILIENIMIERTFTRFYPHKTIASHVVGYLGLDKEITGKTGLEFLCNEELQGTAGEKINTINSRGKQINSCQTQKAYVGQNVVITLDLQLQKIAEEIFPQESAGAFILMDPNNGELEVVLSRPDFDPNIFLNQINHEQWLVLQEKKCFINRAFNACYPPASVFKLVTVAAALENNLVKKDDCFKCVGSICFSNRLYYCNRKTGHGVLNTREAIAHSCNILFYEIAKKIPIDTLADCANRFGLGEKTDVLFNEKAGFVPNSAWKMRTKGERWYTGETLSVSIGQGPLLATPIQIARMISAICLGYFVQPRILKEEPIIKIPLDLDVNIQKFLKNSMKPVATIGTARLLKSLSDFKIYAKTGTAQVQERSKDEINKLTPHAWFVAYFQYKNFSPKTLVMIIENAGTTRIVIKLAHKFLKQYANYLDRTSALKTGS